MKNEALRSGAELAPSSLTLGMSSGRGVVSMRACWLKLRNVSARVLSEIRREEYTGADATTLWCEVPMAG